MPPSNPPKGGSAPWPPERGEVSPLPPSYGPGGPGGTSRPVTGRDEPPSCLRQGRKFRSCSYAETRECALRTHTARALASGPWREIKFFAKLSSKESGGRNVCSLLGMNKYAKWLCGESGPGGPLFLWKQAGICGKIAQSIPQKRGKIRVFRKIPGKGATRFPQVKCMLNACGQNVGKKFAPRYLTQDAGAKAPLCPGFCRDLGSCPKRNFILF